jgi:parallel beta-helix repeat protein
MLLASPAPSRLIQLPRRTLPRPATAVLAALSVALAPAAAEAAPTDLQVAVAQASPGDVVTVPADDYAGPVIIDKPLTVRGAQHGVDARDRSGSESVVDGGFLVTASDVTIDGFTVEDTATGPGIELRGGGTNQDVLNNIVQGNIFGLYLNGSGVTVRHNRFHNNNQAGAASGNGIYSDQGATDAVIDANRFSGGHQNASIVLVRPGAVSLRDLAVTGNQFVDDNLVYVAGATGLEVSGNTNTGSLTHAVQLDGDNTDVDISGNEFMDASWSAVRVSDFGAIGANRAVTVESNTLVGQGDSAIRVSEGAHSGTLGAHYNRIAGDGADGVMNNGSDAVDARWNWWGCNAGPGGAGCLGVVEGETGNVDPSAWLQLSLSASPAAIQTGGQTVTLTADLTRTSIGDDFADPPLPPSPVSFATDLGSVESPRPLAAGLATTTLTSGSTPGTANATATLDSQTVAAAVRFDQPPEPAPVAGESEQQPQDAGPEQLVEPAPDTSGPAIGVVRRRLRLSSRGEIAIKVFCPADEAAGCPLEATVDSSGPVRVRSAARRRKRQVRFGSRSVVIAPGRLTDVRVRFTRRGQRIARRLRKVRLTVTVVSRDALGNPTTVRLPFTLVAPRRRR